MQNKKNILLIGVGGTGSQVTSLFGQKPETRNNQEGNLITILNLESTASDDAAQQKLYGALDEMKKAAAGQDMALYEICVVSSLADSFVSLTKDAKRYMREVLGVSAATATALLACPEIYEDKQESEETCAALFANASLALQEIKTKSNSPFEHVYMMGRVPCLDVAGHNLMMADTLYTLLCTASAGAIDSAVSNMAGALAEEDSALFSSIAVANVPFPCDSLVEALLKAYNSTIPAFGSDKGDAAFTFSSILLSRKNAEYFFDNAKSFGIQLPEYSDKENTMDLISCVKQFITNNGLPIKRILINENADDTVISLTKALINISASYIDAVTEEYAKKGK